MYMLALGSRWDLLLTEEVLYNLVTAYSPGSIYKFLHAVLFWLCRAGSFSFISL
jgi:hypothetical protein